MIGKRLIGKLPIGIRSSMVICYKWRQAPIVKIGRVETILEFESIFTRTMDAVKPFYNLAFFLFKMARFAKRTCSIPLTLFRPNSNNKRTIELINNVVVHTIERKEYSDRADFARLEHIYKDLPDLCNRAHGNTNLQEVFNLSLPSNKVP